MARHKLNVILEVATAFLFLIVCQSARADFSSKLLYDEEIKKIRTMTPLDNNLFGEQINLQDGVVSFHQTDVTVPTKNGGQIEFGRISESRTTLRGISPGWGMNVPYMTGTYDARAGWSVSGAGNRRCSTGKFAPSTQNLLFYTNSHSVTTGVNSEIITTTNVASPAHVFWHGIEINLPSIGNEQLLESNPEQMLPTDGGTYYGTTKSGWRISCIPSISGGSGEGFVVTIQNGTKYFFDSMVVQDTRDYIEYSNSTWLSNPNYSYRLTLSNYFLLATKIVDRFGNTIIYDYDPATPGRLRSIASSDGTRIDISHDTAGSVSEIMVGSRKWTYNYLRFYVDPSSYTNAMLQSITLPDGSSWQFSSNHVSTFGGSMDAELWKSAVVNFWDSNLGARCKLSTQRLGHLKPPGSYEYTVTMTHPSGAKGEFTFQQQFHGMNSTPGRCYTVTPTNPNQISFGPPTSTYTLGVPSVYLAISLIRKKISGPGLASDLTWEYTYNPSWSFDYECTSTAYCDNKSITTISSSNGKTLRYTIGNDYRTNLGKTLSTTIEKNGQVSETTSYSYIQSSAGQPYPQNTGNIPLGTGVTHMYGNPLLYENRPLLSTSTARDDATFTSLNDQFDAFARPTRVQKINSLGLSKIDATEYHDNLSLWVLGQIKKKYTLNSAPNGQATADNMVSSDIDYNAQALPQTIKLFGKLQHILSYWPDGNLNTATDGRGNTTWFGDYHRGVPRLIGHPDGTSESATVNDNGWITSIADENGFVTGYGYDVMGRLAGVAYPANDSVAWTPQYLEFRPLNAGEWMPPGVSAGQWRQYIVQGNYTKVTYYDAMWRPVLVQEYDTSNVNATIRYTRTAYDSNGRVSFQSYPVSDPASATTGVRSFYDALDRVTSIQQDSEHGVLTTTTDYLAGLKVRVTNPRNLQTTTSYMAWDQPGYDLPIRSDQPENKVIEISRHPQFGWPLQLKQRSADNAVQASRQYVYDGNAQLCKIIEPESGATVTGYDAASNPAWSASGLNGGGYVSTTDCSYTAANASGRVVNRTYDARNRLTQQTFPDGKGNQIWTYEKDSLPASVTTYNDANNAAPVVTAYTYNKRRMMNGESLSQPGWYTWGIGYSFDAIGNLTNQIYPTGLNIDYAPNALGQATKAGIYASGAQYYPNGALKQFTYGNGIVHSMIQNERQLPARVTSSGGVSDFGYTYDPNANVTSIWDYARDTGNGFYGRWMTYDGLDRLTSAGSCTFGGDCWHRFTYDALDNLKSWKLGGVKDYADYIYDTQTNHLTSIRNTAGATVMGIAYDTQGNFNNKNGQDYKFDYGNSLREVTGKEAYRYDGLGRRVWTLRPAGVAGPVATISLFQYSQSGQLMYEEYSNTPNGTHVYLAGSLIATRHGDGAVKYQHTDALGSPVAVTNEVGAVIDRNDYEPYGAIIGQPSKNGIGYTGHMMDGATGLTYMQQRYYDQSIGRFLSVDPVTANSANGSDFNRYKYAANNPYRFFDPDGRQERAYGAGATLLMSPEQRRIWEGGERAALTEGSGAEQGAAMMDAVKLFVADPQISKEPVVKLAVFLAIAKISHGKSNGAMQGPSPKIHEGQQGKHQIGHNNYTPGRSVLTADPSELGRHAGTGQQVGKIEVGLPGSKERVDFGQIIGTTVDKAGSASPTTVGMIHYGKSGIHIVPAKPQP